MPTAHLLLTHPYVPKVVFIQLLLGSASYCTFLYAECWAIQRDQLATNTSSEGHCCISTAQTFLLLYLHFHGQSYAHSAFFTFSHSASTFAEVWIYLTWQVFSLHWFLTCSLKGTHIHTHSTSNKASLELSCLLQGSYLKGLLSGSVSLKPISSSLHRRYSS